MAPAVLASFPTFPVLAVSNSYDPINVQSRQDSHFYIDDKEYENCLPRSPTGRSTRSSPSTNFSSCASRLTRRISGGSASTCSSLSSKTGGLTRRARNFVGNLFRSRLSEHEWKRVEEETAAAKQSQETRAAPTSVTPFLSRMADGYTCFDRTPSTTMSWKKSNCCAPRTSTSRFYEHTDEDDDHDDHDEALVPLFRCPAGLNLTCPFVPSSPTTSEGRKLSMTEA